jgi:transcriptional regulator with PAS, ATPase and Fis domain
LFGYEKGAFTGAWKKKPGKFVLAHSGSLLLDEIGEMPLSLQAKLLQVLENNNLDALGSTQSTEIDVRVFAVTNADLVQMVSDGRFRADLYYRLNVVAIHIPPLRERKEDIAVLTDHYFDKYAAHYRREKSTLDGYMQELFYQYSWPGNVRELANIIQSITVLGNEESFLCKLQNDSPLLTPHHSHGGVSTGSGSTHSIGKPGITRSLKEVSKEAARKVETETILDVLTYTRWNRRKASELLGISYKALLNKIKEYQIEEQYRDTINKDMVHTNRQKRYQ